MHSPFGGIKRLSGKLGSLFVIWEMIHFLPEYGNIQDKIQSDKQMIKY